MGTSGSTIGDSRHKRENRFLKLGELFVSSFTNRNSESFWRWILRKNDNLSQVVFFFVSKLHAQNARNFQLFEASNDIRIVYLSGIRVKYTDRVIQKLFGFLIQLSKKKIEKYKVLHLFSIPSFQTNQRQVLHLDDPVYSIDELEIINKWERAQSLKKGESILICTNEYTKNWFDTKVLYSKIHIIEQGFHDTLLIKDCSTLKFSCVYSSPYIDLNGDKHGNHTTWGAEVLINEIIPQLNNADPDIEIHIVGKIGKNASRELSKLHNIFTYGRVDFNRNVEILSKCSIGLYPRTYDHRRSILKIFSYIGAGLPTVAFELVDTSVIKDNKLGLSVNTVEDFVNAILKLKRKPEILNYFRNNIVNFRAPYTWQNLAKKLSELTKH